MFPSDAEWHLPSVMFPSDAEEWFKLSPLNDISRSNTYLNESMNDKPEPPPRKRLISVSHYTRLINAMNVETSPPPVNTWYIPKLISNTPVIWAEGSVPKVSLKSAPPSKSIPTFGDISSQETIQHRRPPKPRLHKCTYPGCYKLFAFSKHWKLHMEGHARVVRDNWRPLNPYPWSKCASKAPLSSAKLMDDHLNNIHINPLICTIDDCNFKTPFTRKTDLHRHIEEFHGQVYNYKFEERDFLKRTYSKIASFKRKAVRILFNGKETFARPDTASDQNIITEAFANEHGIPIHTSTSHQSVLGLGNGTYVTTLGRAKVPIKVLGGDRTISKEEYQWFDVLRRCPVPLILGFKFIEKTKLWTKYKHLLVDSPHMFAKIPTFKWIGSPRSFINFSANRQQLEGCADTGSDLDFMSPECAERLGLEIYTDPRAYTRVMLADESIVNTIGQVHVPSIEISKFDSFGMNFHILPGLASDVIFSEEFLDQMDAFNTCAQIKDSEDSYQQRLNTLVTLGPIHAFLSRSWKPDLTDSEQQVHDNGIEAERLRRNKANCAIRKMKNEEQASAARTAEDLERTTFDSHHEECRYCIGCLPDQIQFPVNGNGAPPSSTAATTGL